MRSITKVDFKNLTLEEEKCIRDILELSQCFENHIQYADAPFLTEGARKIGFRLQSFYRSTEKS